MYAKVTFEDHSLDDTTISDPELPKEVRNKSII